MRSLSIILTIVTFSLLLVQDVSSSDIRLAKNLNEAASYRLVVNQLGLLTSGFQRVADEVGGVGFFAGIKSYFGEGMKYYPDSTAYHKTQLTWTSVVLAQVIYPETLQDEALLVERTGDVKEILPDRFDDYEAARKKIVAVIKKAFPGKSQVFYRKLLNEIQNAAQVDWLVSKH